MNPAVRRRTDSLKHKKFALFVLIGITAAQLLVNLTIFLYHQFAHEGYYAQQSDLEAILVTGERVVVMLLLALEALLVYLEHCLGCAIMFVLNYFLNGSHYKVVPTTAPWFILLIVIVDVMHLLALAFYLVMMTWLVVSRSEKEKDEKEENEVGDEEDTGEKWDDDIEQVLQARTSEPSMKNSAHDQYQLCGIINDGFTCYANACFQMLYTSRPVRDYFLAHTNSGPFHTALGCLFAVMKAKSTEAIADEYYPSTSADFFNQVFRLEAPRFVSNKQHDAQEYMTILLDLLHREANRADRTPLHHSPPDSAQQAWDYHLQDIDNSFLARTMMSQVESVLTCLTCRLQSKVWSCVWQLNVQLLSGNAAHHLPTLKDCLNEYMADEILQGDCALSCVRCGARQPTSKKQAICRVPQALLIHLKRFTPNGAKMDCPVEIDTRLRLSADPKEQLLVHCAILHRGTSNNGHYMTLFREADNKWVLFDDATVYDDISNPQASIIMRKCAYLVMYFRIFSL